MILPGSYANGFAPRDGQPLYPKLWRGCVGAWAPCLGPTGLTLRDWSGRANHGTLTNMDAGTDWVTSQGRYALDFDAVNDLVQANAAVITSGQVSACGWVNRRSGAPSNNNGNVIKMGTLDGDANSTFALYWNSIQGWTWFVVNAANSLAILRSTQAFPENTWIHFAGVATTSNMQIFLNGVSVASGSSVAVKSSSHSINLGGGILSGAQNAVFNGLQSDYAVYNRALSPNEIRLLASRRGIAYELAPRRRSALVAGFNRRRRLLVGA
jgi:hypothetical protein